MDHKKFESKNLSTVTQKFTLEKLNMVTAKKICENSVTQWCDWPLRQIQACEWVRDMAGTQKKR